MAPTPSVLADTPVGRETFAAQVHEAQVRHLYNELPTAVSATLAGTALLAAVMWAKVSHAVILAWTVAMLANQTWRFVLYLRFHRETTFTPEEVRRWGAWWAVGAGTSGLIWGVAAFLFWVDDSAVLQTILIVSIFAVTSVAVLLIGTHLPSFYAFVLSALIPVVVRTLIVGETSHVLLALITAIAGIGIVAFGRGYNRMLVRSLQNRFENEALARELAARNVALDQARHAAEAARGQAEAANRSKTQFFAAASHDLRQPLHALGLFTAALSARVRDPGIADIVRSIHASVDALETLFNELLDISRIDAGVLKVSRQHFAVRDVLEPLRVEFAAEALERGLRLRVRPCATYAWSDPVLVERILRNLVSNAIRYTHRGGVLVGCRPRGGALAIEVWDTGTGIPPAEQDRVFGEFYQGANAARDRKRGLGLGLSIVKRLGALLDAPVALRSRPGRGTMFSLTVPRGERPRAADVPQGVAAGAGTTLAGRIIVVIENDPDILDGMRVLLEGWRAEVVAAASPEHALAVVAALDRAPDLVIADFGLGGSVTGAEAIAALRTRFGAAIPAIVVTGARSPSHLEQAKAAGFHVLTKPVAPAKLRALIGFELAR